MFKRYSRILSYLKPYRGKMLLYFVFVLLSILFSLLSFGMLLPVLNLIFKTGTTIPVPAAMGGFSTVRNSLYNSMQELINGSGFFSGTLGVLSLVCIVIIFFIILKNLFLYLSIYTIIPVRNAIINKMREDVYNKILQLPISYFTETRKGDLISRMTHDVHEIEVSVIGTLEGLIRDPLSIIVTFSALVFMSPQLTLFILIAIPFIAFILGRINKSLRKPSIEQAQLQGELVSVMDETLGGLRVIKAFNAEDKLASKFFGINKKLLAAKFKLNIRKDMSSPLSEVMGVMIFICILWFGGKLILQKGIALDGETFLTYLAMFYGIINPVKTLSASFSNMRKGGAAIERIEEVLTTPVTVSNSPQARPLTSFNEKIELKNVGFSYDGVPILQHINLTIEKGKTIALVGSSGAGKSTLADLVPRFHDVQQGEILIDGVNIKEYTLESIRSFMSIVTQEPILFNDSIENNIKLGKEEATEDEVLNAAKVANAHTFIIKKEHGYKTNIGDRGSKLSGGERQRLTIARALVKNPPILILDEATSSLDTESERLVQDAINNMMQNRTSIVIAHRLSTIRHADEIIVLQKGQIVERGTHQQLIDLNGFYKKLVDMQEVK